MKIIKISSVKTVLVLILLISTTSIFAQAKKKDDKTKKEVKGKFIENKKYKVQFYEMKATGRGKAVESMVLTSGGTIESALMKEKIKAEPATYNVLVDSTYTEDDTPMHLVKIEATATSEKDETVWEATVLNYDIDGTVVEKKNGIEKKKFEFSGSEKTKK